MENWWAQLTVGGKTLVKVKIQRGLAIPERRAITITICYSNDINDSYT